jgi:hypothetical protein
MEKQEQAPEANQPEVQEGMRLRNRQLEGVVPVVPPRPRRVQRAHINQEQDIEHEDQRTTLFGTIKKSFWICSLP